MPKKRTDERRAYEAKWRAANHERHRANQLRWKELNPARVLAGKRKWNEENRDKLNARSRLAYAKQKALDKRRGKPTPTRRAPVNCEACGKEFIETKKGACLDHDHVTGKFRGWLCQKCNTALGMVGDCAEGVRRLLSYLEAAGLLS